MADTDSTKPFSPDEVQRILRHLQQPAVFMNMTCDWAVLKWTAEHLSACLGDKLIRFRLAKKEETNSKNQRLTYLLVSTFKLSHLVLIVSLTVLLTVMELFCFFVPDHMCAQILTR